MNGEYNYDNEIIEIGGEEPSKEPTVTFEEEDKKDKKAKKEKKDNVFKKLAKKIKDKWQSLSKKQKIIVSIISAIILILIIGLIVYFVFIRKPEEEVDNVVLEQENYRYENGNLILLDEDGKELGKYECEIKDAEKCYVAYLDNDKDTFDHPTYLDYKGNQVQKRSVIYNNKYVFITDDKVTKLYNIKEGKTEDKLLSVKAYDTERDLVVVEDNDKKFGVLEFTEDGYEYVINAYYDYLGIIDAKNLRLLSKTDEKERIIGIDNKNLSKEFNAEIKSISKNHIAAVNGKDYNLYTYNFEEVMSGYDYISFHDDNVALVKENTLKFVNANLVKLNEEGIKLANDNYNPVYKYDKKKKLDETEVAYKVTINPGNISVDVDEENFVISIYDGVASSKYSYVNYFDGKLYFYSDVEKNDLIGSYECENKNKLSSETDSLTNCTVASVSGGVSGIYNNNFVFITDNSSIAENKVINLYSIKEKKTKATYTSIEMLNSGEIGSNIAQYYTDGSFILAKSASKNSFGVIKLESSKATNVVSFNYKEIKPQSNYYILQNNDNKYSIYDKNFNKISNEFDYVQLLDKHYVGINGKNLNVYRYDTTVTKLLEEDVMLSSNDYSKAYSINIGSFITIVIDGKEYKYDLNGKKVVDTSVPVVNEGE